MKKLSPARRWLLGFLLGLWLVSLFVASLYLWRYKLTPGASPNISARWPQQSKLAVEPGRPTLLFFAHPKCPCTRASLAELRIVMSRFAGSVTAHAVFHHPDDAPADWLQTDTVQSARTIPGVTLFDDLGGAETELFDAQTSGQVYLFSASGELLFQGGITPARSHMGDNPQRQELTALLASESTRTTTVEGPVFGCALEEER
jgi:hypothetical protein